MDSLTIGFRIAATVLACWLLVWILVIAFVMRGRSDPAEAAREWGCNMGACFASSMVIGNALNFHRPLSAATLLAVAGVCCGLKYVSLVRADPDWRTNGRAK